MFKDKNFYFIDNKAPIDLTLITERLEKLGGKKVLASNKKIDYIVYDLNIEHDPTIEKRLKRLKNDHNEIISPNELIQKMDFDPNPDYLEWDPYPNFDPWTGKKLEIWK